MNREIKFRIWDIENKEMLKVQELDFEPTFYGGRIAIRPDQYNDYFDTEDMILMQYTGLHDKNGKEIYEGDIVGDSKIKWIVKWNKHRMGFSLYPTTKQLYDEMPINVENKLGFKILGNIYDNPELLGGQND